VWFGGTRIYRWDGQRGQDFTDGRVPAIEAMWGSADDDVWAVGRGILHWDGKVWRAAP
jgi:hypothetical protein